MGEAYDRYSPGDPSRDMPPEEVVHTSVGRLLLWDTVKAMALWSRYWT